jgi:hypothetical protein
LEIFQQTNRQLANLANCTDATHSNFPIYKRILYLFAKVNLGAVLVEISKSDESAVETIKELVTTFLGSLRHGHESDISTFAQQSVVAVLDEYVTTPVFILDELLTFIGQGPTILVANPAAQSKPQKGEPRPPRQIEEPNPSYLASAGIIRKCINKLASPVANLLNGILSNDPICIAQSALSPDSNEANNVYDIIYELHRVAPQILTTVIGTVAANLQSPHVATRLATTKLLGRLWCNSELASKYKPCVRDWLARHHDVEVDIRKCLMRACVEIVASNNTEMHEEANSTLTTMVLQDPSVDLRLDAIFVIADWVYKMELGACKVDAKLLQAIGSRIHSKSKDERKNSLIVQGQIYFRHYVSHKLRLVEAGGDDVDLKVILEVLHHTCHLDQGLGRRKGRFDRDVAVYSDVAEETFGWIPRKIFEAVHYRDTVDTDLRSRVVQIVDGGLLGDELSSKHEKRLSSTARAVGLAMILDSLKEPGENLLDSPGKSTAMKYMKQLFSQRAALQSSLSLYLDARNKARGFELASEDAMAADAKAKELLARVASLTAPPSKGVLCDLLDSFHGAKDKHIFRILSTITDPMQIPKTRQRASVELPKRTKALGGSVSEWVDGLVKRCSMGNFFNVENVAQSVILSQQCFLREDVSACSCLLVAVKMVAGVFPSLCGATQTFHKLTELFAECRSLTSSPLKKEIEKSGILTSLSSILSAAAPVRQSPTNKGDELAFDENEDLQQNLMQLCTRDGTPEQARNAVYTLARLLVPGAPIDGTASPAPSKKNMEAFSSLLKALTSPSRMTVSDTEKSPRVVSILSALAALSDCAPTIFISSDRGQKAIKFALESIIMGRGRSENEVDEKAASSDDESDDDNAATPSRSRKLGKSGSATKFRRVHISPEAATSLLEDENLSVPCRRTCAAIDFLVSCVRASRLHSKGQPSVNCVSHEVISKIFELLTQILRDKGLPPSGQDRRSCKSRQDRAALRQCSAIHLLRLCDARLHLEAKYLSISSWHILSETFLDEEPVVREACMDELTSTLLGNGFYGKMSPPLRIVAFISLCSDGDHGMDNDAANGNAANAGKIGACLRTAALSCVVNLRKTCEDLFAQCRAAGSDSKFETYKTKIMPECAMPYVYHLLAHRRETPAALTAVENESQRRILRKRLKIVLDPLVQSLGDSADNISFLIQMANNLGTKCQPVDALANKTKLLRISTGSNSSKDPKPRTDDKRATMLEAKLKVVATEARAVLLSYVKKDVNLTDYPGVIHYPRELFTLSSARKNTERIHSDKLTVLSSQESKAFSLSTANSDVGLASPSQSDHLMTRTRGSSANRKRETSQGYRGSAKSPTFDARESPESQDFSDSARKRSRVHFSPEVQFSRMSSTVLTGEASSSSFGDVSPIAKSATPVSLKRPVRKSSSSNSLDSEEETLGPTPPSALRIATMLSTASVTQTLSLSPKYHEMQVQSERQASVDNSVGTMEDRMGDTSEPKRQPPTCTGKNDNSFTNSQFDQDLSTGRTTRPQMRNSQQSQETELSTDKSEPSLKRKSSTKSTGTSSKRVKTQVKKDDKKTASVPSQISVHRIRGSLKSGDSHSTTASKKPSTTKKRDDSLDFDFDDDENQGNLSSSKSSASTTKKVGKTKTATKSKAVAAKPVTKGPRGRR